MISPLCLSSWKGQDVYHVYTGLPLIYKQKALLFSPSSKFLKFLLYNITKIYVGFLKKCKQCLFCFHLQEQNWMQILIFPFYKSLRSMAMCNPFWIRFWLGEGARVSPLKNLWLKILFSCWNNVRMTAIYIIL